MNHIGLLLTARFCPVANIRIPWHTPDNCTGCLKADRDMWKRQAEDLERVAQAAEEMRDKADQRIAELEVELGEERMAASGW